MDKQTAIDLLDNLIGMVEDNHGNDYDVALHMGIDALKTQLSVESTTFPEESATLDCISRQQAILAIERNAYRHTYLDQIVDIIKWLPSVPNTSNALSALDCVDRQAALEAMDTWDKFGCDPDGKLVRYDDDKHYIPYVHYEDMVHAVKNLPSAEPRNGKWIPVSEALPEHSGFYIVTEIVADGGDESVGFRWFSQEQGWKFGKNPIAWMPLPEPYTSGADMR